MSTLSLPPSASKLAAGVSAWRTAAATTPGRLWLAFGAACLALLVLLLVAEASIGRTRQAIQSIGRDAVPSIVAAQEIRANLADMDASTVNVFISNGTTVQAVKEQYDRDRLAVNSRLIAAAQNITYGDAERAPILSITDNLETYTGLVKAARTKGWPYGIKDLRAASELMHTQLIPAADTLDQVNFRHLNQTYDAARAAAAGTQAGLLAAGGLALAVLVLTQVFLTRQMRRLVNIPLALATLILVCLVGGLSAALQHQNELLRVVKKDCFDSIHALWKARSVAYDANGDESLYLLSPTTAAQYEQSFHAKSASLADIPVTDSVVSSAASGQVPTFPGYLGDELRNITFVGEHDAAVDALRWWGKYLVQDRQIRAMETSGHHKEAVIFCVSTQPGQSNWTFAQFDGALGKVLGINQNQFNAAVSLAFAGLRLLPLSTGLAVVIIVVLTWLGLAPRLREYQG